MTHSSRIAGHLHGLDTADAHGAWLKILLTQLESYRAISSFDWTRLAQQVLAAGADRLDAELALPLPNVALRSYFEEIGQVRYADVMGRGIEAARNWFKNGPPPLCNWIRSGIGNCGSVLPGLRIVARFIAVGVERPAASDSMLRSRGLAASLVELSTELPVLVAEHHRRLNEPLVPPNVLSRQPAPRLANVECGRPMGGTRR